ncbi:hypothetical protein HK104_010701 [Borealophlyctis nickersoniae]|nr:hypothetical protein HK104_010701 [Borealophlyctis nickersoniae]
MDDVLALAAFRYLSPSDALSVKGASRKLDILVTHNTLAYAMAAHLYRVHGDSAFWKLGQYLDECIPTAGSRHALQTIASLLLDWGSRGGLCHAFVQAAGSGFGEIVRVLLDREGPAVYGTKDKALVRAVGIGDQGTVRLLLQRNAYIHVKSDAPLYVAVEGEDEDMVQLLLEAGANPRPNNWQTLRLAVQNGSEGIVHLLLDYGANVSPIRESVLQTAAQMGEKNILSLLVERGADLHVGNERALRFAAEQCDHDVLLWLIDHGADINVSIDAIVLQYPRWNDEAQTVARQALRLAAGKGYEDAVHSLLELGVENSTDALSAAAAKGQESVIRLLQRSWGVGVREIQWNDNHAVRAAAQGGHVNVVALLLEAGGDAAAALRAGAAGGHEAVCRLALHRGADVHVGDGEALRASVGRGSASLVRLLLEEGADVHACNSEALKIAAQRGRDHIVAILLQYGANPRADDSAALRIAAEHGCGKVVQMLLEHGADPCQ